MQHGALAWRMAADCDATWRMCIRVARSAAPRRPLSDVWHHHDVIPHWAGAAASASVSPAPRRSREHHADFGLGFTQFTLGSPRPSQFLTAVDALFLDNGLLQYVMHGHGLLAWVGWVGLGWVGCAAACQCFCLVDSSLPLRPTCQHNTPAPWVRWPAMPPHPRPFVHFRYNAGTGCG
jgi:hypothetical protein